MSNSNIEFNKANRRKASIEREALLKSDFIFEVETRYTKEQYLKYIAQWKLDMKRLSAILRHVKALSRIHENTRPEKKAALNSLLLSPEDYQSHYAIYQRCRAKREDVVMEMLIERKAAKIGAQRAYERELAARLAS